jgi:hypothetical protein
VLTVPVATATAPASSSGHGLAFQAKAAAHDLGPLLKRVPLLAWVAVAALSVVLLAALAVTGGSEAKPAPLPSGVPAGVADELQQLHDAVAGR